jgi:hypothetical protein
MYKIRSYLRQKIIIKNYIKKMNEAFFMKYMRGNTPSQSSLPGGAFYSKKLLYICLLFDQHSFLNFSMRQ